MPRSAIVEWSNGSNGDYRVNAAAMPGSRIVDVGCNGGNLGNGNQRLNKSALSLSRVIGWSKSRGNRGVRRVE